MIVYKLHQNYFNVEYLSTHLVTKTNQNFSKNLNQQEFFKNGLTKQRIFLYLKLPSKHAVSRP